MVDVATVCRYSTPQLLAATRLHRSDPRRSGGRPIPGRIAAEDPLGRTGPSAIDAIGRLPLDALAPETFLALASKLGETMDMDHVATICLAHWPGQVSPWYHDLRRVARYGTMLGKFVTVDEYFRDTDYPGQTERFQADQYRSPYLPQAVHRE